MSSGLRALPAGSPARLLPLPISQHLPDSHGRPWVEVKEPVLEPEGFDVAMGYECYLAGLQQEEPQLLGCQEVCALRMMLAGSLPPLMPRARQSRWPDQTSSPPGALQRGRTRAWRPGGLGALVHPATRDPGLRYFVSEMSYFV